LDDLVDASHCRLTEGTACRDVGGQGAGCFCGCSQWGFARRET
jgi:hypothetical protein